MNKQSDQPKKDPFPHSYHPLQTSQEFFPGYDWVANTLSLNPEDLVGCDATEYRRIRMKWVTLPRFFLIDPQKTVLPAI